jgi:hypothetical protein
MCYNKRNALLTISIIVVALISRLYAAYMEFLSTCMGGRWCITCQADSPWAGCHISTAQFAMGARNQYL